jgi:hypothetical protein
LLARLRLFKERSTLVERAGAIRATTTLAGFGARFKLAASTELGQAIREDSVTVFGNVETGKWKWEDRNAKIRNAIFSEEFPHVQEY